MLQDRETPLMVAVYLGEKDIVKLLLDHGPDVTLSNKVINRWLAACLNQWYISLYIFTDSRKLEFEDTLSGIFQCVTVCVRDEV